MIHGTTVKKALMGNNLLLE